MRRGPLPPPVLWGLAALLAALLVSVAVLQHRWVGEISRVEQQRTRSRVETSARRLASDFDGEITRCALLFQTRPGHPQASAVTAAWERWQATALVPELVAQVWVAERGPHGDLIGRRFDSATRGLLPAPWPPQLGALAAELAGRGLRGWGPLSIAEEIPALAVFGPPLLRDPSGAGERGTVLLVLDRAVLSERLFPLLVEKHFGPGELELALSVVSRRDGREIFRAGPSKGQRVRVPDVSVPLLAPAPFARHAEHLALLGQRQRRSRTRHDPHLPEGHWLLLVSHPAGSLELAVAKARHRNLALSSVILALLAGSIALLFVSTRQALALARRQLDFVAGVSHELLTPLAAIRSAGQNLADGVVTEGERVARYGSMILREGDRLTDLVRRVLAMAGIEAGGAAASFAAVAVGKLVEEALEAHQPALGAASFSVEAAVAPDLPEVQGDAAALRRALDNLIGNAVKYGADGRWLRVEAEAVDGAAVEISVSDRGQGIAPQDLPHVFERFYRGRDLAASRIPGAGLGLALVKEVALAHGGSVRAESTPGSATRFTLRLPVARKETA